MGVKLIRVEYWSDVVVIRVCFWKDWSDIIEGEVGFWSILNGVKSICYIVIISFEGVDCK